MIRCGYTEYQENKYCNSYIHKVKPVKKMVEITEWQNIHYDD